MQFTRRQRQISLNLLILWGLITALCTIGGPFGTLETLNLPARLGYWGLVVFASIAGSILVSGIACRNVVQRIGVWMLYTAAIALGVHLLNMVLFPGRMDLGDLIYLFCVVAVTVLVVNGLVFLAERSRAAPVAEETEASSQARFLQRLPVEKRGALVRIEAQDHYLNVVTSSGSAMILLRMNEAVKELTGAGGLQVHRSHWVKVDAVIAHKRVEGRDMLRMADGAQVPVARNRRDAARAEGLF